MSKLIPSSSLGSSFSKTARVGVLGLQGDFSEHLTTLRGLGVDGGDVRRPEQLDDVDALIIPGGESTTIGKLAQHYGIIPKLRERAAEGMPVWGTCAGAIFLAKDSFEADLDVDGMAGGPFHAVFIRAPKITRIGPSVAVLARLRDGTVVAARDGVLLATSFHPELTHDERFHRLFLALGKG